MNKAKTLSLIKKVASILLVFCFVLPLSKCTTKVNNEEKIVSTDTYLYGFEMVKQGWVDIEAGKLDGAGTLLAVFNVFFVPIVCLRLKERPQAIIYFASFFLSGYILYSWVFLFSTSPQIGGVLAVACWILLFCTTIVTLWHIWRNGMLFNRELRG
jgi:hypothetical protein